MSLLHLFQTRERSNATERVDEPQHDLKELEESLRLMSQANRFLGVKRSLERALAILEQDELRVLDVGAGNGDLLAELALSSTIKPRSWRFTGVDLHPQITSVAHSRHRAKRGIEFLRADGTRLPFRDRSQDIVLCTLTLHHFEPDRAVQLLREMCRVASRLVIVSDLERRRLGYLGAWILSQTLWRRNRLTRYDGPLSVLRAFTHRELTELASDSGLREVTVERRFPFHLMLSGRPG